MFAKVLSWLRRRVIERPLYFTRTNMVVNEVFVFATCIYTVLVCQAWIRSDSIQEQTWQIPGKPCWLRVSLFVVVSSLIWHNIDYRQLSKKCTPWLSSFSLAFPQCSYC